MLNAKTLMGKEFKYTGSLEKGLIIHKKVEIHIPLKIIQIIRNEIERRSPVLMGACRDNPIKDSIGETLLKHKLSPQNLSYVIPLLIEVGFCNATNNRPYIIMQVK
jgi:hypothetical protein